jgi:hypothetical protein
MMVSCAKGRENGVPLKLLRSVLRLVDVVNAGGSLCGGSSSRGIARNVSVCAIIDLPNATKLL